MVEKIPGATECNRTGQVSVMPGKSVLPDDPIARTVTVFTDCSNCTLGRRETQFDVTKPFKTAENMGYGILQVEKNTECPFRRGSPGQTALLDPNRLPKLPR